jgi:hypothetical protein
MSYLNKPVFLEKDDLIKMQADQIECLRKELHGAQEMNQMYINDIIKIQKEQMKDCDDVLDVAVRSFMAVHKTNELMGSPWITFPLFILFFGLGIVLGASIMGFKS